LHKDKSGVASKLFGVAYGRPDPVIGEGGLPAVAFFNECCSTGVELNAMGKHGFPLLYELLTGTLQLRLFTSDDPHNFARLLVRLLPGTDYMKQSTQMSTMRILAENPAVAGEANIPKFQVDSAMDKLKGIFKGKDAVTRLLSSLHDYFTKQSVSISFPTCVFEEHVPPGSITLADKVHFFKHHRLWVIPRVTNYSRRSSTINVASFSRINVSKDQLVELLSIPLRQLGTFVNRVGAATLQKSAVKSQLPFELSNIKAATTHCSERTMQRLRSDVSKYASMVRADRGFQYNIYC